MKRTLIHTNKSEATLVKNAWNKQKESLQAIINLYKKTGLPELLGNDLHRLFNDTTNFLFDKITGGSAHLAVGEGDKKTFLPLSKESAIAILQKPEGYEALIEAMKNLFENAPKGIMNEAERRAVYHVGSIAKVFMLDAIGDVQFTADTQNAIDNAGAYFINSEAGNKQYQFVQDVVKAYYANGMDSICKNTHKELPELIEEVLDSMDDTNKTFVTKEDFARTDREYADLEN